MRMLPWEYAVRNLARHRVRLISSIGGSALVVLLVLAAAAFVRGMEKSMSVTPGENILLIGAGSEESLERSEIRPSVASEVSAAVSGIKTRMGVPYVSAEVHMATLVRETPEAQTTLLTLLRGITPPAFLVHPQVRITEGRAPNQNELLVGRLAAAKMGLGDDRLAVGKTLWFDGRVWTISGRFEAPGTVMEAEIWVPLRDLQLAAKRDNISCVVLTLGEGAELGDVDLFAKQRLDLELVAIPEARYYEKLLTFYQPVKTIIWLTAMMIALGGLFGGLNTMYAAFSTRVRELAALQTIGYSRLALVVSLVQESLLASAAGALIACVVGILLLDGLAVRISMGAFGLVMDGPVVAMGLAAALILGIVGALPPAYRCLRLSIAEALKSM